MNNRIGFIELPSSRSAACIAGRARFLAPEEMKFVADAPANTYHIFVEGDDLPVITKGAYIPIYNAQGRQLRLSTATL